MSAMEKEQIMQLVRMLVELRNLRQREIEVIDEFLNFLEKPLETPQSDDVYDRLPWESREGAKGPFQMVSEKACQGMELFQHLKAILKQNKGRYTEKAWTHYYWLGTHDESVIFRRKKKRTQTTSKPQSSDPHAKIQQTLTNIKIAGEKLTSGQATES